MKPIRAWIGVDSKGEYWLGTLCSDREGCLANINERPYLREKFLRVINVEIRPLKKKVKR